MTLGMLVVALLQVAGRVSFSLLDELEPAVNQLLATRGITVSGLSGDWRLLNPVLRIDRVELPAGYLDAVVLEVGMMESVLRGTLVARRLRTADGQLNVEKPEGEPWRLVGARPAQQLNPLALLRDSDQIEFDGSVVINRAAMQPARLTVSYLGINRGGEHRHRLTLRNVAEDCAGDCRLRVDFHGQQGLWPLRTGQARMTARGDGFLLPRPLLGMSPLYVTRLRVGWQRSGEISGGTLQLATEQFDMPGDATLATQLNAVVRGHGDRHRGLMTDSTISQGDEVWALPQVTLRADSTEVSAWLPALDLGHAAGFLRRALAAVGPAERWLSGLNIQGNAHNVRIRYGLDGTGLAYALTLDAAAIDGFKGVPTVRGASGELFGYERGLLLNVNAQDMVLALPEMFTGEWPLPYAQGSVQAWFGTDYFGVRGTNLRAETAGTRAAGGFAMSRPPDREGQRLALLISTDRIGVAQARQFVPYRLPDGLRGWLESAPRGGELSDARVAYQGQFQDEPGELGRRLELAARVRDGHVRYHDDWPAVTDVAGALAVAGQVATVNVERATSAGARMGAGRVRLVDGVVDVSLEADAGAADVLGFMRTTPLRQWLAFVEPDWQAGGVMHIAGDLRIPIDDALELDPEVRLRAELEQVDLSLPGYRVNLHGLDGHVRYRYPYHVDAGGVTGRLFGEPVTLAALTDTEAGRVHLQFDGRARPEDVWRMVDMADPGLAQGTFDFQADLGIAVADGEASELTVETGLTGLALRLPAGYGKEPDAADPAGVRVVFRPDYSELHFDYRDAAGWLHVADAPLRGAIGFAGRAASPDDGADELVLSGHLAGFDLEEILPDTDAAADLSLPIGLDELAVGRIGVGDLTITSARLNGRIRADGLNLDVGSDQVVGSFSRSGTEPFKAELETVALAPAGDGTDAGAGIVLDPALIAELPAADVVVERLMLGEEDFGKWQFRMRPEGDDLQFTELQAEVRGVTIDAPDGLVWLGEDNETRFQGSLSAGDLAEVLPLWGYAPTAATESASLSGEFTWPGSPIAVELLALRGQARAQAEDGRFLDVEAGAGGGAQRIFSLLNFTNIAKRMTFNFDDVFGRGISFDELTAAFTLDDGLLEFIEPLDVKGTGSRFRVSGTVDLAERRLDNEMIVTLPVSQSLPWYAAYVALANPLAGLGVLVGERVLRKPIEQFSSARYRIGGTLDDPDVTLAGVFDVTSDEPAPPDGSAEARVDAAAEQTTEESEQPHE